MHSDRETARSFLRGLPVLQHVAPAFDLEAAPELPQELFWEWLTGAVHGGVTEPHAMTLSTVDAHGHPDARVLILKDVRDDAWWFATDTTTAKAAQLRDQPRAALTFYWPTLGRQIRLRGSVALGSRQENEVDFVERSAAARAIVAAAHVTPRSASRSAFRSAVAEALAGVEDVPTSGALGWATYGVRAESVEFWQADPERLHGRLLYSLGEVGWRHQVLSH